MAWSALLVLIIAKLRSDNYMKPFLIELCSPPILLAFVISFLATCFFYEPLPLPERQTVTTLLARPTRFMQSLFCNFQIMLNILGLILPCVAIYSFVNRYHPEVMQAVKDKVNNFFK
jgi:hypothetical protein